MNNEKEIEEMAKVLKNCIEYDEWEAREYGQTEVDFDTTAYNLFNAGIGDKKQAVKEFAEKLKGMFSKSIQYGTVRRCIDKLYELYGEKE